MEGKKVRENEEGKGQLEDWTLKMFGRDRWQFCYIDATMCL